MPVSSAKHSPVADLSRLQCEIECPNALLISIGEIHYPTVRTPGNAVGNNNVAKHTDVAAIRMQTIQASQRLSRYITHCARPEPPAAITPTIVEPVCGTIGFRLSQHLQVGRLQIKSVQAALQGQDQSATAAEPKAPHGFRHGPPG